MNRVCPRCGGTLNAIGRHGVTERTQCIWCEELPTSHTREDTFADVTVETEFDVMAIHDNSRDFFLRLSRLVTSLNVVQLKQREITVGEQRVVPLGNQTNSVGLHTFMKKAAACGLVVEVRPTSQAGVTWPINHGDSH